MSINEVLTEKDLKERLVLTCVGYAEMKVTLLFTTGNFFVKPVIGISKTTPITFLFYAYISC